MRLCRFLGLALLVGAVLSFPAFAQVASGTLSGTVVDSSGAVLPGVDVTVTNQGSNRVFTAVTSGVGTFRITNLIPGLYEVRVALDGFKTYVARGVKINVDDEYSLTIRLEVGSVSEELTVVAGVDLVKTTDNQISTTIGQKQIVDLPLNGRNPLALITLQAGTGTNGNTPTAISGLRTSFTNITQDGVNIQDNFIRSNATTFVPNRLTQSQVGEFTVATQNQNVSSGFGASQVNFVTPSGTNDYHGEVYWVHRNSAVGATDFFDNISGNEKAQLIRNQFGFSVAGPVVKDKLLFYGNYDGFRERQGTSALRTVLTPSARQGLFRYVAQANDPANGISAGDIVEIDLLATRGLALDPLIQNFISQTPATFNDFSVGDSSPGQLLNRAGYRFNQSNNEDRDQWGFRLDYNLNDRHSFEGIYRWSDFYNDRPDIDNGYSQTPAIFTESGPKFFSTAWNWTVSENLINEVRFGANLSPVAFRSTQQFSQGFKVGLDGSFTNPETNFEEQGRETNTWIFQDNASWQRGAHSFRFGVQSQSVRIFQFNSFNLFPTYNLGTNVSNGLGFSAGEFAGGISSSGVSTANLLIADLGGAIDNAVREFNITSRTSGFQAAQDQKNWLYDIIGVYFGDSWRVHPRVTLNLGLRWEYYNQLRERDGLITQPLVTTNVFDAVLDPNNVVDFVEGRLIENDFGNWAPTVGLAWDPFGDGKTSIRAAYGIAYVNDEIQRAPGNAINRYVVGATSELSNLNALLSQPLPQITPPDYKNPLTWDEITNPASPFFVETLPAAYSVDPNLQVPYAQTWTLGVQREIGWNMALEARYVGTRGTRLVRAYDVNQTEVRNNGFLADFIRAQNNAELAQAAGLGYDPRFNANIPGSQPLPVFDQLAFGGLLTNGTVRNRIQQGEAADLGSIYFTNGLQGSVQFVANPAVFVADATVNGADSTYHAIQLEASRRFTDGLVFNANYSFGKTLTNSAGAGQTNFDPILDLANPDYDRGRASYDVTHTFNANFIYELPFGRGRRFDISNNVLDKILGGWEVTSIFNIQSGDPFGILSNRGTLNRRGRASGRNRASSTLGNDGVRDLVSQGSNANGPFYLDPSLINNFTNPGPSELGNLPRFGWNGPSQFNWDFGLIKRTAVTEDVNIEFRGEFFNFTNRPNFNVGNEAQTDSRLNINSSNFGRISFTNNSARIVQFSLKVTF